VNDLAPAAEAVCPGLADLRRRLTDALPLPVHMTGSGSALFVLCDDEAEADAALARVPPDIRPWCVRAGPAT
jgi:4-diphosphocytidyl-2C-methyl-D-erythritol kinase